jgi:protein-tyrosine-phosphatase/DNA-binding transcriptional ArsR family regulator
MMTQTKTAVPPFLDLAGHPVRWRMLVELAGCDRQVGELTHAVGLPQGLVSYHLARLRDGGLVSSRRSSHDARAVYYRVHLDRCVELLAATGTALHPGLSPRAPSPHGAPIKTRAGAKDRRRASVLFVCTGNGTRSQIAEALLCHASGGTIDVCSAGSHPKAIHPNAIKVLAEIGLDISVARSKPITQFSGRHFDYVITLCDKVREICPKFPGLGQTMHWSIADPSAASDSLRATTPAFRALLADLESRIRFLISLIDNHSERRLARHG